MKSFVLCSSPKISGIKLSKKSFSNSLDIFDGSSKIYNSNELTKIIFQEIGGYTQKFLTNLFTIVTDIFFIILFLTTEIEYRNHLC